MIIDELDLKILDCLGENARMSFTDIGKRIGLTSPAIAQRVQKMELEGIIKGYTITLDHTKLGWAMGALITVKISFGQFRQFLDKFKNSKEVLSFYRITGEDCVVLNARFKNNEHLLGFIEKLSEYGLTKTNIILEEITKK